MQRSAAQGAGQAGAALGGGWASDDLPPAMQLACACCMWPPSEARNQRVRAAAAVVDWAKFLRVVARQRIAGLAQASLKAAGVEPPRAANAALRQAAQSIATAGAAYAAEAVRLQTVLAEAQLPALFVKGAALAQLAYGSQTLKHCRDIDILVFPYDLERTIALLQDEGYAPVDPKPLTPALRRIVLRLHKDIELRDAKRRLNLEAHWRLIDNPVLLEGVGVASPTQTVALPSGVLTTLADAELFAYLCVHGATHGWFRLKWLADLNAWLTGKQQAEIAALFARTETLGVGACAAQALSLCRRLLGLPLPAGLEPKLSHRKVRRMVTTALDAMAGGEGELELAQRPLGPFRLLPAQFRRGSGWRFLIAQCGLLADSLDDRLEFPLPSALAFLYLPLRLPFWLVRVSRRRRPA